MSDAESEKSTLDADYEAWKALFVKDGQIKPIKISELEEILKDKNPPGTKGTLQYSRLSFKM